MESQNQHTANHQKMVGNCDERLKHRVYYQHHSALSEARAMSFKMIKAQDGQTKRIARPSTPYPMKDNEMVSTIF